MVFIDTPPLAAIPSTNAEKLAQSSYNKLMPWTFGTLHAASVTSYKLTINKIGSHNKVTFERAFTALEKLQEKSITQLTTTGECPATDLEETDGSQLRSTRENAVDHIKWQKGSQANIRY